MTAATSAFADHGGRLDEAARRFPDAPRPWLDLSTGINPVPWRATTPIAIDHAALPTLEDAAALCHAATETFGAASLPIAALPGSEIGLRLLATIDPPRPWRVVRPGYRTHDVALLGATAIDAAGIADVRDGTLLLANPNNPDGRAIALHDLLALARRIAGGGGLLVVDEAFADAMPETSLLPLLTGDEPVLAFRSFGKFFGLAGVRLGFACGHARTVAAIAGRVGSWPVSAAAIALGTPAYRDAAWIAATRAELGDRAAALDALLGRHGLKARGGCPLFRLVTSPVAPALFLRLARAGILVRPFDYAPEWLRFGVPADAAGRERLDRALRDG